MYTAIKYQVSIVYTHYHFSNNYSSNKNIQIKYPSNQHYKDSHHKYKYYISKSKATNFYSSSFLLQL